MESGMSHCSDFNDTTSTPAVGLCPVLYPAQLCHLNSSREQERVCDPKKLESCS